jgi:hypothetical protein
MTSDISRESVFLSASGGVLDIVQDGEVLASVSVPAGRVSAREYVELLPYGAELHVAEGLAVVQPRRIGGIQHLGAAAYDSGANPDYKPTPSSRLEAEMRLTLRQMQAETKRVEARRRALDALDVIPKAPEPAQAGEAPAPEGDDVVVE